MALTRREFIRGSIATAVAGLFGCAGDGRDHNGRDHGPFDVCVIGSGFAGTYLALRTASQGLDTVIVEAGPPQGAWFDVEGTASPFYYTNSGEIDYPVDRSRLIAVGGTSAYWAGMVNRLRPSDFRVRSEFGMYVDWPITYDDLQSYYCDAEQLLATRGYPAVPGVEPPRRCDYPWPEAGDRAPRLTFGGEPIRVFSVARSHRQGTGGPVRLARAEIPAFLELTHAGLLTDRRATELVTLDGRTIDHVRVASAAGDEERVRARCYVLAAGVVESARLLLRSRSRWFPEGVGNTNDLVGRFFVAHPTVLWNYSGPVAGRPPRGVYRTYDFNDRFRADGLNACQFQLRVHEGGELTWMLQPEMEPRPENRITLAAGKDAPPVPNVAFQASDRDGRTMVRAREFLLREARALGAELREQDLVARWRYHPSGVCRMGPDDASGVVDRDGKVFGVDNLYVSGASVFPNPGTANPTVTVVAMTLRLADRIVAR